MTNTLPRDEAEARRAQIAALTRAGHTAKEIALIVGVTPRSVERIRGRCGVALPPATPMTEDEIRAAAAMLDDGASYGEVSRTIGRSVMAIRKHLPGRSQWQAGSGVQYRAYMAALDAIPAPASCYREAV